MSVTQLRADIMKVLRDHEPATHIDGLPADEFECCADALVPVFEKHLAAEAGPAGI